MRASLIRNLKKNLYAPLKSVSQTHFYTNVYVASLMIILQRLR